MVLWDNQTSPESCISSGYTVHPANVAISLTSTRLPPTDSSKAEVPQEIKNALMKVRAHETNASALAAVKNLKQQFSTLETTKKREILAAKISNNKDAPERAKNLVLGLEKLENSLNR